MPIPRTVLYGVATSVVLVTASVAVRWSLPELPTTPPAAMRAEGSRPVTPRSPGVPRYVDAGEDLEPVADPPASTARGTSGPAARAASDPRPADPGRPPSDAVSPRPAGADAPSAPAPAEPTWRDRWAALSGLFGSSAPSGPAAAPSAPHVPAGASVPPGVREVFYGESEATACQPGPRQFALDRLRDLYICVVWGGLVGTQVEQLTLVAPDGHAYQTITRAFVTADAAPSVATVEVEGRSYPVEPAGWGAGGAALVVVALPVAGTFITQHTLAGTWRVRVALNGRLVDEDTFTLTR